MGADKATLVLDGTTLAARAAAALREVADPCVEVGPGVSGLASVQEDPPGGGPLLALAAAVAALPGDRAVLVVACDLPRLSVEVLRWLADHPADGSVVPLWEGRPQPLCARWSAAALARVGPLVASGARSLQALIGATSPQLVEPPRRLVPALADVDTPGQWERVRGIQS